MPRRIPRFDKRLLRQAQLAIGIVRAGEIARRTGGPVLRREWTLSKLEALYELAFLRLFVAWEVCLEDVFYRTLCGYASSTGQETLVVGTYYPSLAVAQAAVLPETRRYLLWSDPATVIRRCRQHIASGRQETTIASHQARLAHFASVRHRIVHGQEHARHNFNLATLAIAGRTYLASSPGRFLRDRHAGVSYLETILSELHGLAGQIV